MKKVKSQQEEGYILKRLDLLNKGQKNMLMKALLSAKTLNSPVLSLVLIIGKKNLDDRSC